MESWKRTNCPGLLRHPLSLQCHLQRLLERARVHSLSTQQVAHSMRDLLRQRVLCKQHPPTTRSARRPYNTSAHLPGLHRASRLVQARSLLLRGRATLQHQATTCRLQDQLGNIISNVLRSQVATVVLQAHSSTKAHHRPRVRIATRLNRPKITITSGRLTWHRCMAPHKRAQVRRSSQVLQQHPRGTARDLATRPQEARWQARTMDRLSTALLKHLLHEQATLASPAIHSR